MGGGGCSVNLLTTQNPHGRLMLLQYKYLHLTLHIMLHPCPCHTIVSRVDGELDDGVADVRLRLSGSKSFFGGSR